MTKTELIEPRAVGGVGSGVGHEELTGLIGDRARLAALAVVTLVMMLATPSARAMGGDWNQDIGNGWWIECVSSETRLVRPDGKEAIDASQIGIVDLNRYAWAGRVLLIEAAPNYFVLRESDIEKPRSMDRIAFDQALKELGVSGEPAWKPVRVDRFLLVPLAVRWALAIVAIAGIAYVVVARWRRSRATHVPSSS